MSGTQTYGAGPPNATQNITGTAPGTPLMQLMEGDAIEPGSEPSYQLCKLIYIYHPLGGKIVDSPIAYAQSLPREITVQKAIGIQDRIVEAFTAEWHALKCDDWIANLYRHSRIYGIATLAVGAEGVEQTSALSNEQIATGKIYFSVFDPLNTSGSMVLDQTPTSPDFQRIVSTAVQGNIYHRSRVCVAMNESPIYIQWTSSAYGFVGRSVYQRALYQLKSFIQTMVTDDMVARKAGLLVYKAKQPGSIVNAVMAAVGAIKRALINFGTTNQTIQIGIEESIETLNMMNVDNAGKFARDNILKNIAVSVPMPASWLNEETLAEGFGEGTEDAKKEARYIDRMRMEMQPAYEFMDKIVQTRAWSPSFYKTIQADFPGEYGGIGYEEAFYAWRNSFKAMWPNTLTEPDSERAKSDKVRLDAIIAALEVMLPSMDPENKARLIEWAQDNFNEFKELFKARMNLDFEALAEYVPPTPEADDKPDVKPDAVPRLVRTK